MICQFGNSQQIISRLSKLTLLDSLFFLEAKVFCYFANAIPAVRFNLPRFKKNESGFSLPSGLAIILLAYLIFLEVQII